MDTRTVITFDEMAKKLGRKIPARGASPRKVRFNFSERSTRVFPDEVSVLRQGLIEAQSPLFTQSSPVERGDQFEFSSRGLTDWYVRQFCATNHLKT